MPCEELFTKVTVSPILTFTVFGENPVFEYFTTVEVVVVLVVVVWTAGFLVSTDADVLVPWSGVGAATLWAKRKYPPPRTSNTTRISTIVRVDMILQ
jgi:hypothetical protein